MANRFGTTTDMVIQTVLENNSEYFLVIDKKGLYLTTAAFMDSRLADPNRYTGLRESTPTRLAALGLDYNVMFKENQHRIKSDVKENARKVNPLKASKRQSKG